MFKKHDKVNALHLILKYSGALKTSEKQKQYAALTADTQRCILTPGTKDDFTKAAAVISPYHHLYPDNGIMDPKTSRAQGQ